MKRAQRGFTLVEIIVYSAIFVLLLGAIVNSVILLSNSYERIKLTKNVQSSGLTAMDRITRDVRSASGVSGTSTVYNVPGGALALIIPDSGGGADTFRYYLSGGRVLLDKNGVLFGPLTADSVNVSSLVFRPVTTGNSSGVKIEMTIEQANFYNTAMLRNSY